MRALQHAKRIWEQYTQFKSISAPISASLELEAWLAKSLIDLTDVAQVVVGGLEVNGPDRDALERLAAIVAAISGKEDHHEELR